MTLRIPEVDIIFEIRSRHRPGILGKIFSVIGSEGGLVGDITTKFVGKTHSVRDITISVFDVEHQHRIEQAIAELTDAEILQIRDPVFERHKGGKIHSGRTSDIRTLADFRYVYTPGVARVCTTVRDNPAKAREYTGIANSVGIFTNGTRVLGLGDIGALASLPLMEGKALLYDQFVGISATPMLIETKDPEKFVEVVEQISPSFGGIHLEDIRNPDCFYIEDELIRRLHKPVMHNDQHGTATIVLAAVMSAMAHIGHRFDQRLTVAQIGLGAAGFGIAKLLIDYGVNVIGFDPSEEARKRLGMLGGKETTMEEALSGADIVIAATGVPGLIKPDMIRKGQIIFALSNPVPEIYPEEAIDAGAAFAADGRQINNALAYPGLLKAALEMDIDQITPKMKMAAATAIFELTEPDELVPDPLRPEVHKKIVEAVKKSR
ncbi:MAG: NAD-dependent malic enzyme [Acidobacteria bacterium]|nr:NAD-dependent malic enzyme [Acidobacteriota bacterium]